MTRQVASELLKIRTLRGTLWIAAATLVLVGLPLVSVLTTDASDVLAAFDEQRQIVRIASVADVFALLLGIVIIGSELSHGTITHTFLVEPVRRRVLTAKAAVAAALGLALAAIALAFVLIVGGLWLSAKGIDLHLDGYMQRVIVGILVAGTLAAALGVGWGALFRGQTAAVTAAFVYLLIGENILRPVLGDDRQYTPAAAFEAVVNASTTRAPGDDLLTMWPGALLAAAYTAGFVALGALVLDRRDV